MVGSHEDANDLLQNCFLRVWNNLHSFRGDARLSTWLYKIAVNESINFLNKERQRRNLTAGEGGEDYIIEKLKVIHTSMAMTCRKPCRKQSHPFRKSRRLVFNMRYYDELKYEEISEILGTSVGALKASYHHAMKKSDCCDIGTGVTTDAVSDNTVRLTRCSCWHYCTT